MLWVMTTPRVAAIRQVKTAVRGTTRKTRRCTRLMFRTVWACCSPASWSTFSTSSEVSDSSGRTWFARRRCTARQSLGGQCGDGLKLPWQRALNGMEGRQDGGISLQVERQQAEGAHCSTGVLQDRGAKGSAFRHESTGVLGVGEILQPVVKRQETGMD